MSQALLALDTDHIKRFVFGTNKLKEIRGASSLLDSLNRLETVNEAKNFHAQKIFAHGGSALFLLDTEDSEKKADQLGQAVQRRYRQITGNGASITYAVQPVPPNTVDLMTSEQVTPEVSMQQLLRLLRVRLRLAKEGLQTTEAHPAFPLAQPTHPFLCPCESCGVAYAETLTSDQDKQDGRYCRVCMKKRKEDENVKEEISHIVSAVLAETEMHTEKNKERKLWERILQVMSKHNESGAPAYDFSKGIARPHDFQVLRNLGSGKNYLSLIYADADSMGQALEAQKTLTDVETFARRIDDAVFEAMGEAIKAFLPAQDGLLPFDILLVGGDDIVMVTHADKALDVAQTLAQRFSEFAHATLSIGVVFAPVAYPFYLQLKLAEELLKDAKKAGAANRGAPQEGHMSFVVVTGNTSLSYKKIHDEMQLKNKREEFHATLRPYTLSEFVDLLASLRAGKKLRLGRTKLHQLREAILHLNHTTTILETLSLFRNWSNDERDFIRKLVAKLDTHLTDQERRQRGTLFPWYLASKQGVNQKDIYRTPLFDFIELYDFVSSQESDA